MMPSRAGLIAEYRLLMVQLYRAGIDPVVTDEVLDCFTDAELMLLVKDSALRLVAYQRLQAESRQ